jgi:hypothetical protein
MQPTYDALPANGTSSGILMLQAGSGTQQQWLSACFYVVYCFP